MVGVVIEVKALEDEVEVAMKLDQDLCLCHAIAQFGLAHAPQCLLSLPHREIHLHAIYDDEIH
jgi:hypothetical protein